MPVLEVYSSAEGLSDEVLGQLSRRGISAIPDCINCAGEGECVLPKLAVVEVTVVSDDEIAAIHGEFLDDPTPTDVITFQHGEILISFDTALAVASDHGNTVEDELLLYLIHGLLHLNGHLDSKEGDRKVMHRIQDRIWNKVRREI